MPEICNVLHPKLDSASLWLHNKAARVTSQHGEDGIIEAILDKIGVKSRWCVEFGASDGHYLSNTWNLINHKGFSGVLIELQKERGQQLQDRYAERDDVHTFVECITIEGESSLDSIFGRTAMPEDPDLVVIDVDGIDWHLWRSIQNYRPRVLMVEFNPSMPNNLVYVQDGDPAVNEGSSVAAMVELGKKLGYELVCVLEPNAFFVRAEDFEKMEIPKNDLDTLRPLQRFQTQLVQFYNGRLAMMGCNSYIWEGTPIVLPSESSDERRAKRASGQALNASL